MQVLWCTKFNGERGYMEREGGKAHQGAARRRGEAAAAGDGEGRAATFSDFVGAALSTTGWCVVQSGAALPSSFSPSVSGVQVGCVWRCIELCGDSRRQHVARSQVAASSWENKGTGDDACLSRGAQARMRGAHAKTSDRGRRRRRLGLGWVLGAWSGWRTGWRAVVVCMPRAGRRERGGEWMGQGESAILPRSHGKGLNLFSISLVSDL